MDEFAEIAETYDWTERSTDDIPFFVDLATQAQGPILEIGAGTGRITIPVAKLSKPVTALDVSEGMLSRARARWNAEGNSSDVSFVLGDFRSLALSQSFGLVFAGGRTFEHALSDVDRLEIFVRSHAHLQPSGVLAIYVWGPPSDADPAPPERSRMIERTNDHGTLRFSWREERDLGRELRRHYFRVEELDGLGRTWQHSPIELRWYTAEALDALGRAVGLAVRNRYEDFRGSPYRPGSLHMIWVYEKQ